MKIQQKDLQHNNDMLGKLQAVLGKRRVAVFIDAANVYFGAQKKGIYLSYETVAEWFRENCRSAILNFYTAFNPGDEKQDEFLKEIESFGYNIIKKPVKIFADTNRKGNMDIELSVDAMRQKDEYDIIVLMSGDGDFQYLFQALKNYGKKTLVLGVGGFTSFDLHNEADYFFFMNRVKNVWKAKKREEKQYFIYLDELSGIDYGENGEGAKNGKVSNKTNVKNLKEKKRLSHIEVAGNEKKINEENDQKIRQKISAIFDSKDEVKEKLEKLKKLKSRTAAAFKNESVKELDEGKKQYSLKNKIEKIKDEDGEVLPANNNCDTIQTQKTSGFQMQELPYDKAEIMEKPLQRPFVKPFTDDNKDARKKPDLNLPRALRKPDIDSKKPALKSDLKVKKDANEIKVEDNKESKSVGFNVNNTIIKKQTGLNEQGKIAGKNEKQKASQNMGKNSRKNLGQDADSEVFIYL